MSLFYSSERNLRRFLWLGLAAGGIGLFPTLGATNPPPSTIELFPNPVIVKGDGFQIRKQELIDRFIAYKATLSTQGVVIFPEQEREVRKQLLDHMILTAILKQRATPQDRKQAEQAAQKMIADAREKAGSEEAYRRQLWALGMTPKQFEQRAHEQALVEQVINREIRSKITVSDEELKLLYDKGIDIRVKTLQKQLQQLDPQKDQTQRAQIQKQIDQLIQRNLARLHQDETVRAQLIVFYTIDRLTQTPLPKKEQQQKLQLAQQILQRLRKGEDFTKIALTYSEDPDVQQTKGIYRFTRRTPMPPELRAVLFQLPIGQWSDVIRTSIGYYLIRVLEKQPPGKIPFEKARPILRELLTIQKVKQQLPAYLQKLEKEYHVQILPGALD